MASEENPKTAPLSALVCKGKGQHASLWYIMINMKNGFSVFFFVYFAVALFFFATFSAINFPLPAHAQSAQNINESIAEREARLRAELAQTEKEIEQWRTILKNKQSETASIQRDADILNAKIAEAKLVIKARNIAIEQLGKEIKTKEQTIESLNEKIERGRESLSQLIRKTNEIDSYSTVEMVLSGEDISDFFTDVDSFGAIKRSLGELFFEIRTAKAVTEAEKTNLNKKKSEETDIKVAVEATKRKVEKDEAEKKQLLRISQTQEKTYQQVLSDRQKRAAQIRSALFALRDSAAIPFGTALTYANAVFAQTGVRPAFLLAILTQESNLGENVGTCNRPGDPQFKKWQSIMPGPAAIASGKSKRNDQAAYLRITGNLGLDPDSMPLSCPWQGGWGGAMGPAQFIPTTWEANQSKISTVLGKSVVNPWDPQDAFMASGIYLAELGAAKSGYTAEKTAALKYYAGGAWSKAKNAFYGNEVMAKAQNIQENMIDPLQNL